MYPQSSPVFANSSMCQYRFPKIDETETGSPSEGKKSGNQRDWERFKGLQTEVQKSTRKAHRNYMENSVSADFKEYPKRFWSFIKSKRQEASGVSELVNRDGFLQSNTTAKTEILN